MDYGHKESDKMLKDLEKRLQEEYAQAERELAEKVAQYFKAYERKNAVKLMQLKAGQITEKEYLRWKKGQLLIGQRWQEMQDTIATDLHNVNKIAGAMISTHAKDVYALNHNYGTYEVEKGSLVDTSYTLYNRDTVERLMRDNPDILPPPGKYVSQRIAEGKDVKWNKQQVQSVMTQSILQGESIPKIAKRLEGAVGKSYTEDIIKNADQKTAKQIAKELARKNKVAAIRNARTMTTGAENAGRVDAYKRGQEMGVKSQQMWVATLDSRTRHEHRLLDGQKREVGEPFEIDGEKLRFPGDPTAPGYLVYNCRCGVIAVVKGSKLDKEGIEGIERRDEKLGDMTYDEWKNAKAKPSKPQDATKPDKGTNTQPEVKKPENEPLSKPESETKTPRTIEIPQDVREKIDAFENKYQDAKTEHFLSINKDGEVIYESGSGGKRNVSVPKHIDEQMEDGWGIHNHPAKAVFSPEDVRNYEKYGEHGLVIDNDGNEYILFNHNPVAKYKELESATHEQFVELMPFSTEYNKAFNQIDDDISARRREYFAKLKETEPDVAIRSQKAQEWMRENDSEKLKIKWLEENAEDYGFTFQMTKKGGATIAPAVPEKPKHVVAQGKDLSDTYTRRPDEFAFEIEDAMNAQGFDGMPQVVSAKEFDKAVKAANNGEGFIAQRTYSAPDQETLDAYRDQLYNGKWYVDCSTGGAQYGQGMYCAADYTGTLSDGIKEEMRHYKDINAVVDENGKRVDLFTLEQSAKKTEYKRITGKEYNPENYDEKAYSIAGQNVRAYMMREESTMESFVRDYDMPFNISKSYTETLTLMPDAKILKIHEAEDAINYLANEYIMKKVKTDAQRKLIQEYDEIQKRVDFLINSRINPFTREELNTLVKKREALQTSHASEWAEINDLRSKFFGKYGNKDSGVVATIMGYDAINAYGHGESGSYTVILNRTKCIIKEDKT